jgi:hypothetical protein
VAVRNVNFSHRQDAAGWMPIKRLRSVAFDRSTTNLLATPAALARFPLGKQHRRAPVLAEVTVLEVVVAPDAKLPRELALWLVLREVGEVSLLRVAALYRVILAELRDVLRPDALVGVFGVHRAGHGVGCHRRKAERGERDCRELGNATLVQSITPPSIHVPAASPWNRASSAAPVRPARSAAGSCLRAPHPPAPGDLGCSAGTPSRAGRRVWA